MPCSSVILTNRYSAALVMFIVLLLLSPLAAISQTLPSSADPSRINPLEGFSILNKKYAPVVIPEMQFDVEVPDAAKRVQFRLTHINSY